MRVGKLVLIDGNEFGLAVVARYDEQARVTFQPKSDRPEKQRAEMLTSVAAVLAWARKQGMTIEVTTEGTTVRG